MKTTLLLGTRKGLIVLRKQPKGWKFEKTHFTGIPVSLAYVDQRDKTWWACLDHGHWGRKLHRSKDEGHTWVEVEAPKYPEGTEMKEGVPAMVRYIWAFTQAGDDKPGELYLGTEPGGLFQSKDHGDSWELVESLWDHPSRPEHWFGGGRDYAGIHSIVVDPRDSDHLYIGISCAGVFESTNAGKTWLVRNQGLRADYLPDPQAEVGHDPHMLVACHKQPDALWQQNHCGIFKSTDGAKSWQEVTDKKGPAKFGFAMAVDHEDSEQAWVVPAVSDEIRVAIDGALTVCRTDDGGKTWQDFRKGLPQENCFDLVYRHALDVNADEVVFGTTTGNLFHSQDRGTSWDLLGYTLPMVYSVDFV
ncbi:MAG: WD40/YVTN/BNR-like repeat-containing protein [Cyclobacteriaceae bacterium]